MRIPRRKRSRNHMVPTGVARRPPPLPREASGVALFSPYSGNGANRGESHEKALHGASRSRGSRRSDVVAGDAGFRIGGLRSQRASQRLGSMRVRRPRIRPGASEQRAIRPRACPTGRFAASGNSAIRGESRANSMATAPIEFTQMARAWNGRAAPAPRGAARFSRPHALTTRRPPCITAALPLPSPAARP